MIQSPSHPMMSAPCGAPRCGVDRLDPHRQRGLTMVELMVAVVVGGLAVMAAMGSAIFFDASKRSQMGATSAMGAAVASLTAIQKDLRMAGNGFSNSPLGACAGVNFYNGQQMVLHADEPFRPVEITNGGRSLIVRYADSTRAVATARLRQSMSAAQDPVVLANPGPFVLGSHGILASPDGSQPCTVITVTGVQIPNAGAQGNPATGVELEHQPGQGYNPVPGVFTRPVAYDARSGMAEAGRIIVREYRLDTPTRRLLLTDWAEPGAGPLEVASEVVGLRVRYGLSATNRPEDRSITEWQDPVGIWAQAPPVDAAHYLRLRAVQVGLIVRSENRERRPAGGTCTASQRLPAFWPGGPLLSTQEAESGVNNAAPEEWRCFRYREASVVVALRNFNFRR